MYRGKDGVHTEGIANQWLPQLKTHPMWESQQYWWCSAMLAGRNLAPLFPERLHPPGNGDKCRDQQPNIRSIFGSLDEESGIEVSNSEESNQGHNKTTQSQLTLDHGGSKSLGLQLGRIQKLDLDTLHICTKTAVLFLCSSPNRKDWAVWVSVSCHCMPVPIIGFPD